MKILEQFDNYLERIVSTILVLAVLAILLLSVMAIVLRWFQLSQLWLEPLVRHLVFFSTFLGGVVATGRGTHIGIDLLSRSLEKQQNYRLVAMVKLLISLVSIGTLGWLMSAAYSFMQMELEYGKPVFWGIHSGVLVGFIPVGFLLIALRFVVIMVKSVDGVIKGEE